jgi:2-C-methyl-D-erythritol 4-phosphate cytidylyltransferase
MIKSNDKYALITAGGIGSRMKSETPKQFMLLNSKPILMHTIERFFNFDNALRIILVLPENQFSHWQELCRKYNIAIDHTLVAGGATRFESVQNGLKHIPFNGITAVHDGVRPFVSVRVIAEGFSLAEQKGTAIPVSDIPDSLRFIDGDKTYIVDRNKIKRVGTPQIFRNEILKNAFEQAYCDEFTDEASVVEKWGYSLSFFSNNSENIKITTPDDLKIAYFLST